MDPLFLIFLLMVIHSAVISIVIYIATNKICGKLEEFGWTLPTNPLQAKEYKLEKEEIDEGD